MRIALAAVCALIVCGCGRVSPSAQDRQLRDYESEHAVRIVYRRPVPPPPPMFYDVER